MAKEHPFKDKRNELRVAHSCTIGDHMPVPLANRFFRMGFIDMEQVNLAKKLAQSLPENGPLDPILTISNLTELQALGFLAQVTGLAVAPASALADFPSMSLQGCPLNDGFIKYFEIIPISWVNNLFVIVVADPTHLSLLRQIEFLSGLKVACKIATLSHIQNILGQRYRDYQPKRRVWQRRKRAPQGSEDRSMHHERPFRSANNGDFGHQTPRNGDSQDQDFDNWGPSPTRAPESVSVDSTNRTQEEVFGFETEDTSETDSAQNTASQPRKTPTYMEEITSEEDLVFDDEPAESTVSASKESFESTPEVTSSSLSAENLESMEDLGAALDGVESEGGDLDDLMSEDHDSPNREESYTDSHDMALTSDSHDMALTSDSYDPDPTDFDSGSALEDAEASSFDDNQELGPQHSSEADFSVKKDLSLAQMISRIQLIRTRLPEFLAESDIQGLLDHLSKNINNLRPVVLILKKNRTCVVFTSESSANLHAVPSPNELISWYEESSPGVTDFYCDSEPYGSGLIYEPSMTQDIKIAWILCEMSLGTAQLLDSSFARLSARIGDFTTTIKNHKA